MGIKNNRFFQNFKKIMKNYLIIYLVYNKIYLDILFIFKK